MSAIEILSHIPYDSYQCSALQVQGKSSQSLGVDLCLFQIVIVVLIFHFNFENIGCLINFYYMGGNIIKPILQGQEESVQLLLKITPCNEAPVYEFLVVWTHQSFIIDIIPPIAPQNNHICQSTNIILHTSSNTLSYYMCGINVVQHTVWYALSWRECRNTKGRTSNKIWAKT